MGRQASWGRSGFLSSGTPKPERPAERQTDRAPVHDRFKGQGQGYSCFISLQSCLTTLPVHNASLSISQFHDFFFIEHLWDTFCIATQYSPWIFLQLQVEALEVLVVWPKFTFYLTPLAWHTLPKLMRECASYASAAASSSVTLHCNFLEESPLTLTDTAY